MNTTAVAESTALIGSFLWIIPTAFIIVLYINNYRYRPNDLGQVK
jgi:hypothetical protein